MNTQNPEFLFCEDREGWQVSQKNQKKEEWRGGREEISADEGRGSKNFPHTEEVINEEWRRTNFFFPLAEIEHKKESRQLDSGMLHIKGLCHTSESWCGD